MAQNRIEDSRYLGCIIDPETIRIDRYLAKAADISLPLEKRKVAARIAAALLESAFFSKQQLPE